MDIRKTRTWAEVSLSALRHNAHEIQNALPEGCGLLGVVKAGGYGHGAVEVSAALREAGCRYLAVACPQEALALREAGETLPILILGAVDAAFASDMVKHNITLSVECTEKSRALSEQLKPGERLKVHLKLDTGMGRLGFRVKDEENLLAAAEVAKLPNLEVEGVFTHFSVSDTPGEEAYTEEQLALFLSSVEKLESILGRRIPIRHCANSGAVLSWRGKGAALDLVRPGILTYGVYPDVERGGLDLTPVMEVKSRVSAITHHKKGDSISYGRLWTAERDCTLAVLPIGYADGLLRALSGKLEVQLRGRRVKQVGRICMDMCMLDVTDMPEVSVGDVATVFGRGTDGGPTVSELARLADTIPYELLCGVSLRVPRVYIE